MWIFVLQACELMFFASARYILVPWLLCVAGVKLSALTQNDMWRWAFKKKNAAYHTAVVQNVGGFVPR